MIDKPITILIAEDDPVARELLGIFLKEWGYDVLMSGNGNEAWDMLNKHDISIALLDWIMPGKEGIDICREYRKLNDRTYLYIIIITAKDNREDTVTALNAGADDYIKKPFDENELKSRIQSGERIYRLKTRLEDKVKELEKAIKEITELRNLLPICSYCKKVRDDHDYWHQVENYLHSYAGIDFTHSVCPDCMEKYVEPEIQQFLEEKKDVEE